MKQISPAGQMIIEKAIDRDFDQTALHVHTRDTACPTCDPPAAQPFTGPMIDVIGDDRPTAELPSQPEPPAETPSRDPHVGKVGGVNLSPALLEQRIINLTNEKARAIAERDILQRRVEGFERLIGIFAKHIDAMQQAIDRHNAETELRPAA